MRTAQVHIRMTYWYEVEIYEQEAASFSLPMLVYRIVLRREEIRTLPSLLLELGVDDVCIEEPILPYYRKELIAARQVFHPECPPSGLVQLTFW